MKQKEYIAECRDENGKFAVIRAYECSLKDFESNIRSNGYTIRFSCAIGHFTKVACRYYNRKDYCRQEEFEGLYQSLPYYSNYVVNNGEFHDSPNFE